MYDLYLWVFILSIVFYVCYVAVTLVFYYRKKKALKKETEAPKEPMQTAVSKAEPVKEIKKEEKKQDNKEQKELQILKEFITKNLKQGFKADVIKQALLKQGWPKEKVEQAFK